MHRGDEDANLADRFAMKSMFNETKFGNVVYLAVSIPELNE
jgi:hypothetical protein